MSLRSTTLRSRKSFAIGLVAGVAALSLSACTSNDSGGDDDAASAPTSVSRASRLPGRTPHRRARPRRAPPPSRADT